ncbi:MAG: hypothetical protein WA927_08730, partial [Rhodococcus sp. (in: high G+C Gram-positive bacteria)]
MNERLHTVEISRLPSSGRLPQPEPEPQPKPRKIWPQLLSIAVVAATFAVSGLVAYQELWPEPDPEPVEMVDGFT